MRVCGPAHNNLGIVYYRQKKYYLAAWEFQHAARLYPTMGHTGKNRRHGKSLQPRSRPLPRFALPLAL
jgi:hypothetical protein